ncbi:MAG: HAD-IIB family hydrolase, partial [Candidatus Omnitrophica bacterium]|nr:HAD-IIB family hydrolase [Candidatus Omnitrophota bacterium]
KGNIEAYSAAYASSAVLGSGKLLSDTPVALKPMGDFGFYFNTAPPVQNLYNANNNLFSFYLSYIFSSLQKAFTFNINLSDIKTSIYDFLRKDNGCIKPIGALFVLGMIFVSPAIIQIIFNPDVLINDIIMFHPFILKTVLPPVLYSVAVGFIAWFAVKPEDFSIRNIINIKFDAILEFLLEVAVLAMIIDLMTGAQITMLILDKVIDLLKYTAVFGVVILANGIGTSITPRDSGLSEEPINKENIEDKASSSINFSDSSTNNIKYFSTRLFARFTAGGISYFTAVIDISNINIGTKSQDVLNRSSSSVSNNDNIIFVLPNDKKLFPARLAASLANLDIDKNFVPFLDDVIISLSNIALDNINETAAEAYLSYLFEEGHIYSLSPDAPFELKDIFRKIKSVVFHEKSNGRTFILLPEIASSGDLYSRIAGLVYAVVAGNMLDSCGMTLHGEIHGKAEKLSDFVGKTFVYEMADAGRVHYSLTGQQFYRIETEFSSSFYQGMKSGYSVNILRRCPVSISTFGKFFWVTTDTAETINLADFDVLNGFWFAILGAIPVMCPAGMAGSVRTIGERNVIGLLAVSEDHFGIDVNENKRRKIFEHMVKDLLFDLVEIRDARVKRAVYPLGTMVNGKIVTEVIEFSGNTQLNRIKFSKILQRAFAERPSFNNKHQWVDLRVDPAGKTDIQAVNIAWQNTNQFREEIVKSAKKIGDGKVSSPGRFLIEELRRQRNEVSQQLTDLISIIAEMSVILSASGTVDFEERAVLTAELDLARAYQKSIESELYRLNQDLRDFMTVSSPLDKIMNLADRRIKLENDIAMFEESIDAMRRQMPFGEFPRREWFKRLSALQECLIAKRAELRMLGVGSDITDIRASSGAVKLTGLSDMLGLDKTVSNEEATIRAMRNQTDPFLSVDMCSQISKILQAENDEYVLKLSGNGGNNELVYRIAYEAVEELRRQGLQFIFSKNFGRYAHRVDNIVYLDSNLKEAFGPEADFIRLVQLMGYLAHQSVHSSFGGDIPKEFVEEVRASLAELEIYVLIGSDLRREIALRIRRDAGLAGVDSKNLIIDEMMSLADKADIYSNKKAREYYYGVVNAKHNDNLYNRGRFTAMTKGEIAYLVYSQLPQDYIDDGIKGFSEYLDTSLRRRLLKSYEVGFALFSLNKNLVLPGYDKDGKAVLRDLIVQEAWSELQEAYRSEIEFGTAGIRGKRGNPDEEKDTATEGQYLPGPNLVSIDTVRRYTLAVANWLIHKHRENDGVVIGRDTRIGSERFLKESVKILRKKGIKVYYFDSDRPIAEMALAVSYFGAALGIEITASHNPKSDNGYKLSNEFGAQLFGVQRAEILEEIARVGVEEIFDLNLSEFDLDEDRESYPAKHMIIGGAATDIDFDKIFKEKVLEYVLDTDLISDDASELRIYYDPLYGAGRMLVYELLTDGLGVSVVRDEEHNVSDGRFSGLTTNPDPAEEENINESIRRAELSGNFDIVLATDPDSDRAAFAVKDSAGTWNVLSANDVWSVLAWYRLHGLSEMAESGDVPDRYVDLLSNGSLIVTWVTTDLLAAIAHDFGLRVLRPGVGFNKIAEVALDNIAFPEIFSRYGLDQADRDKIMAQYKSEGVDYVARTLRVGRKNVMAEIEEILRSFLLGGFEESNGVSLGGHTLEKDGLLASVVVTEVALYAKRKGLNIVDLLNNIYSKYGYYSTVNLPLKLDEITGNTDKKNIMQALGKLAQMANDPENAEAIIVDGRKVVSVLMADDPAVVDGPKDKGFKFIFEDGSFVIPRPSGTEGKIRFYGQAYVAPELLSTAGADDVKNRSQDSIERLVSAFQELAVHQLVLEGNKYLITVLNDRGNKDNFNIAKYYYETARNIYEGLRKTKVIYNSFIEPELSKVNGRIKVCDSLLMDQGKDIDVIVINDKYSLEDEFVATNLLGVLVFDVDATIAERDKPLDSDMVEIINNLNDSGFQIVIITGQGIEVQKPRLASILRPGVIVYSNESTQKHYVNSQGVLEEDIRYRKGFDTERQKAQVSEAIYMVINARRASENMPAAIRDVIMREDLTIFDRTTQLAFKYHLTSEQREYLAELVRDELRKRELSGLNVRVSGKTTISVYRSGISKATALNDLILSLRIFPEDIIYFGDEFFNGGNDRPILSVAGVTAVGVGSNYLLPAEVLWAGEGISYTYDILKKIYGFYLSKENDDNTYSSRAFVNYAKSQFKPHLTVEEKLIQVHQAISQAQQEGLRVMRSAKMDNAFMTFMNAFYVIPDKFIEQFKAMPYEHLASPFVHQERLKAQIEEAWELYNVFQMAPKSNIVVEIYNPRTVFGDSVSDYLEVLVVCEDNHESLYKLIKILDDDASGIHREQTWEVAYMGVKIIGFEIVGSGAAEAFRVRELEKRIASDKDKSLLLRTGKFYFRYREDFLKFLRERSVIDDDRRMIESMQDSDNYYFWAYFLYLTQNGFLKKNKENTASSSGVSGIKIVTVRRLETA